MPIKKDKLLLRLEWPRLCEERHRPGYGDGLRALFVRAVP
jgi:hypothetical protein